MDAPSIPPLTPARRPCGPVAALARASLLIMCLVLSGCLAQHRAAPTTWFASHNGVAPKRDGTVTVCHGFGCYWKSPVRFTNADRATMRRLLRASGPEGERKGIAALVAWAETRVAPSAGSAADVGGLDLWNARRRGQMDCIDEATNTTSYLLIAQQAGLLKHHRVTNPVARGFFLDGRYPHATATVIATKSGTPYAVDSWPRANGKRPDMVPLKAWIRAAPSWRR